jgi:hypothetical protein
MHTVEYSTVEGAHVVKFETDLRNEFSNKRLSCIAHRLEVLCAVPALFHGLVQFRFSTRRDISGGFSNVAVNV